WNDVAIHACRLLNATEKVIFLTPQQLVETKDMVDHAKSDGLKVVTIPDNIREKISGLQDSSGSTIRDLEGFRDEWNRSFEFKFVNPGKLTKEERIVFERTDQIADLVGGLPKNVKKVMISETMRIEASRYGEATGLWEAAQERIIIKRTQLRSVRDYAGTLLHEIAHARSGTSDISREFEDHLTSLLGLMASSILAR
ncbi:ATP-binding protein, partial [Candidatus Bathyarchaeota archaeon]|nr:ATP-binding protein [Candidatus Bathyarchaeota archaeon]